MVCQAPKLQSAAAGWWGSVFNGQAARCAHCLGLRQTTKSSSLSDLPEKHVLQGGELGLRWCQPGRAQALDSGRNHLGCSSRQRHRHGSAAKWCLPETQAC
jgi:hypothetical protein